jgi:hypothetical protein
MQLFFTSSHATASASCALISLTATAAPFLAKTSAQALPIPLAAPVTSAIFPSTLNFEQAIKSTDQFDYKISIIRAPLSNFLENLVLFHEYIGAIMQQLRDNLELPVGFTILGAFKARGPIHFKVL